MFRNRRSIFRKTVIQVWCSRCCFFCGAATQRESRPSHSWGFLDHTQRHTTVGRSPLDEWSARRRNLYLTAHNTHNRQTSMPLVGFEPTISAGERPQTYALDRAATGTCSICYMLKLKKKNNNILRFYNLTFIRLYLYRFNHHVVCSYRCIEKAQIFYT